MEEVDTTCAKSELWRVARRAARTLTPRRLQTNPLNRWTVLDYFALTHFYDASEACLNERALAAGRHRSETADLPCAPGEFEFTVSEALEPTLFVLVKQSRSPPAAPQRLAAYFVLHGSIYPAPSLHAVASARLQRAAFQLRGSLEALRAALRPAAEAAAAPPLPLRSEEDARVEGFILKVLHDFDAGKAKARAAAAAAAAARGEDGHREDAVMAEAES